MFGFNTNKKSHRAICEWIKEKWEFSHTGNFEWSFDLGSQKVFVKRTGFELWFEENRMETSYTEFIRKVSDSEVVENRIQYTFSYFLDKIMKVESVDAPNIDIGFWGKPVLELGVVLHPQDSEKAIVKKTVAKTEKRLKTGEVMVGEPVHHEIQVLDRGYIYLGNGADLHLRGKQAFEDLIRITGGLRKKQELY